MTSINNKDAWEVITSFFDDKGIVAHQLESFDDFIFNGIPRIIESSLPLNFHYEEKKDGELSGRSKMVTIKFGQVYFTNPDTEIDGEIVKLYPNMARQRKLNYTASMYIDMTKTEFEVYKGVSKIIGESRTEKVHLGKMPIMLKSSLCNLKGLTETELVKLGEDINEFGGYFIINGSEKLIVAQEGNSHNKEHIFPTSKDDIITASIKSVPIDETRGANSVAIYYSSLNKTHRLLNKKVFIVYLQQYLKTATPLFCLFKALGIKNDDEIKRFILYDKSSYNETIQFQMEEIIESSREETLRIQTQEQALEIIGSDSKHVNDTTKDKKLIFAKHILVKDFLPHLGNDEKSLKKKAIYLGHVINKMLKVILGIRDFDDRDHFGFKRIDTSGALMETLFKQSFEKFVKAVRDVCNKRVSTNNYLDPESIMGSIDGNMISSDFRRSLSTGNWIVNKKFASNKTGISQQLSRLSYLAVITNLRKLISSNSKDNSSKIIKPRMLHNTQWGMVCPIESPDGKQCGYIKNLSMLTNISIYTDINPIIEFLSIRSDLMENIYSDIVNYNKTRVFINGDLIGLSNNDKELFSTLKKLKLNNQINPFTSIVYNPSDREINIQTDAGRTYRPLFVVDNINGEMKLRLNTNHIQLLKEKKIDWKYLVSNGIVEYLDTMEHEQILICMNPSELKDTKLNYTHCEIHPAMIMGMGASLTPFPDHNPASRNNFQSGQGKQAMGIYAYNYRQRFDTMGHILWYPQTPIAKTKNMNYMGVEELPAGINAIVAIACFTGYNQEDSVLINKHALDRGFFRSSYYRLHESDVGSGFRGSYTERFEKPDKEKVEGIKKNQSYDHLDENGLPRVGYRLQGCQPVIGKTTITRVITEDERREVRKDASKYLDDDEYGIVDDVFMGKNEDGQEIRKVKLRQTRIPETGDKFSSRHGQKGTCGLVMPQEDLPFTKSGIVPDIIINSHCIPSRMTVAHLIECLYSKEGALNGEIKDTTPFEDFNPEDIQEELKKHGFEEYGNETMYNGMTGEVLPAKIFIGPTYYQRLKHMVKDKIHVRSRGPMQSLVRQPTEGRSRNGGLRFGEMERDCIISGGASAFLREKTFVLSDMYKIYICDNCGMFANYNPNRATNKCKICDHTELSQVELPYACKLLFQELMTMGIAPKLFTK